MRPFFKPFITLLVLLMFSAALAFTDLTQSRYPEAIRYLSDHRIVGGYPDGTFQPHRIVNRAELIALTMRAANLPQSTRALACFRDVPSSSWFAADVCNARARGIINGYEDATFRPAQTVRYAEALKIVLTALDFEIQSEGAGAWYEPYVMFAASNQLPVELEPTDLLTREVMAGLIYQAMRLKDVSLPALPAIVASPSMETRLSAGCGQAAPASPPLRLAVGGRERNLISYIPWNYAPETPRRLIVAFHGRTNSNLQVRNYYELEAYAPDAIIVYPAGLNQGRAFTWSGADYPFFDAILEEFSGRYCIDLSRVYVVGHSLGAWFANSVACARGDRVRAVASLGGGVDPSTCTGQVAAMVLHNPKDRLVSFHEGEAARDLFLSVSGLSGPAQAVGPQGFNCMRYGTPEVLNPVVWCPHEQDYFNGRYYPHNWPEDTAGAIVDFFESLP